MKLVIFGLAVSSSWGNGHATLWRGLIRALGKRGHQVVFYEHDAPYYAQHRDLTDLPGGRLCLYTDWQSVLPAARRELLDADVGIVTSYCPDGVPATNLLLDSRTFLRVFYDLDTPVTLERLSQGKPVPYLGPRGLRDFDLVLSYTGGEALHGLRQRLGARRAAPLYGSVDPEVHRPVPPQPEYRADLSYLGTYAADRQATLERLFIEAARRRPDCRFVLGGAQYPECFPWTDNVFFLAHVAPDYHPVVYSSSRYTLNVTRGAMAAMGYCPSARLFEAAACGTPVISDAWEGLEMFFEPGREIVVAHTTNDVLAALDQSEAERQRLADAARERVMLEHTAECRAIELEEIVSIVLERAGL